MGFIKRLGDLQAVQHGMGHVAATYLRLVWATSPYQIEPANFLETLRANLPVIVAMWHGQHFMIPCTIPVDMNFYALVSRSRDGGINATICHDLGVKTVRASGGRVGTSRGKGGAQGFRALLAKLGEGASVALTANIPKGPARVAGPGIIRLAAHAGRPIIAVAFASRRRIALNTWDKACINLPFSKSVLVGGTPMFVPADADAARLEDHRIQLQESLNAVTERAYALVDDHD